MHKPKDEIKDSIYIYIYKIHSYKYKFGKYISYFLFTYISYIVQESRVFSLKLDLPSCWPEVLSFRKALEEKKKEQERAAQAQRLGCLPVAFQVQRWVIR